MHTGRGLDVLRAEAESDIWGNMGGAGSGGLGEVKPALLDRGRGWQV